jgi:hypothetical protein
MLTRDRVEPFLRKNRPISMKVFLITLSLWIPSLGFADYPLANNPEMNAQIKKWQEESLAQQEILKNKSPLANAKAFDAKIPNTPGTAALKNLIRDYREILKPEAYIDPLAVGGSNAGINAYTKNMGLKNLKFGEHAESFYKDIAELDAKRSQEDRSESSPLGMRPSLADTVGNMHTGNFTLSFLKAGWLWDLALRHAEGDPNKAMRLIGICGHDDTARAGTSIQRSAEEQKKLFQRALDQSTEQLESMQEQLIAMSKKISQLKKKGSLEEIKQFNISIKFLESRIARQKNYLEKLSIEDFRTKRIFCPIGNSLFYVPQSLGLEVDIPRELKTRITKAQSPSDFSNAKRTPGKSIPAKYYHVYGAAFIACEMIARGHSPQLVSSISSLLGYAYRTERMNTMAQMQGKLDQNLNISTDYFKNMLPQSDDEIGKYYEQMKKAPKFPEMPMPFTPMSSPYSGSDGGFVGGFVAPLPMKIPDSKTPSLDFGGGSLGFGAGFPGAIASFDPIEALEATSGTLYDEDLPPVLTTPSSSAFMMGSAAGGGYFPGAGFPSNGVAIPYVSFPDVYSLSKEQFIIEYKKFSKAQEELSKKMLAEMKKLNETQMKKTQAIKDAIILMERWTLSGRTKLFGKEMDLPYTSIRVPIPSFLEGSTIESWVHTKPKDWDNERFESAKKRFNSMIIDWEWTAKQHEIGGNFAAAHCKSKVNHAVEHPLGGDKKDTPAATSVE